MYYNLNKGGYIMKNKPLTEQIRQLNSALYSSEGQPPDLQRTINAIAESTGSVAYLISKAGAILAGYSGAVKINNKLKKLVEDQSFTADAEYMKLLKISEPVYNEKISDGKSKTGPVYVLIPVIAGDKSSALLMLCRPEADYSAEETVLAEIGALLLGIIYNHQESEKEEAESRDRKLAEGAFESLSYSEVEAIQEILKNITNNESVVIASKIADSLGITRSVIVNALRKFESAGIIESRSLGMKGTFIRIKNKHALDLIISRADRGGFFA
jgi:transcriptional pleiotropic repressor